MLRRELRHLQVFARNFAKDDTVKFPAPVASHSSARVLTMERLDGVPLTVQLPAEVEPTVRSELARRGARVFLDMIFRDGFFHADPHPGNVLVLPGGVIGLLDAGMVGRVDDAMRGYIEKGMIAVMTRDAPALTDLVMTVGQVPPAVLADFSDIEVAHRAQPWSQIVHGTRRYRARRPEWSDRAVGRKAGEMMPQGSTFTTRPQLAGTFGMVA